MTTLRDIGVSALINIGLVILFLVSFVVLSAQPVNDRVYYPKLYIKGIRKGRPRASPRQLKPIEKYFNLECAQYIRLFEWAKSALRRNEDDIIQHAGLDSAVFLRIFLVGLVCISLACYYHSSTFGAIQNFKDFNKVTEILLNYREEKLSVG